MKYKNDSREKVLHSRVECLMKMQRNREMKKERESRRRRERERERICASVSRTTDVQRVQREFDE